MQNRVSGQLAVTRAFGDLILKKEVGVLRYQWYYSFNDVFVRECL